MHRFRKKSDAKRSQLSDSQYSQDLDAQNILPELPPTNDFRTSLILPDLSRRFSLLRSSSGDPVPLEHLRSRLAGQRARGAPNQISEEEEDMLLETFGRLRSTKTPSPLPASSQDHAFDAEDSARNSVQSTGNADVTSSPNGRSKRYSNNLFGSGRLRDYTYLKSVASSKASISSNRAVSLTPTEASGATKEVSSTALRPVTPEGSDLSSSVQSTPSDNGIRSAPMVPPPPFGDNAHAISVAEHRLQKTLSPAVLKRASMALGEAIKELEDEVEDEILLPRSVPIPRGSLDQPVSEAVQRNSNLSNNAVLYEAAMAISIDQTIHDEFSERRQSPIPARTVPGYVPGMPRPMTPRDFDFDEQRSHSTTPRAQSPYTESPSLTNISTHKIRRESISSISRSTPMTPVSVAPLFLQRSTNGRYTPDDGHRSGGGDSVDFDNSPNSSILGRRRPASPLSGSQYQPMTAVTNRPSSRPTTPSNVIWTPNPNHNGHKSSQSGHSRNNSWTADAGMDYVGSLDRHNKPAPRTLKSPAFPESPTLDFSSSAPYSSTFANPLPSNGQSAAPEHPHAYIPDVDIGSPLLAAVHAPRSQTPTQITQRSPISPTFSSFDLSPRNGAGSRRSSRQNPPPSPFTIGPFPTSGLSPRPNSSRSSVNSVGSSYNSWDEPDKVLSVFTDSAEQQSTVWHDIKNLPASTTPGDSTDEEEWDPEEIIQRYTGLKKTDIAAVHEKLVAAALAKLDPRERAPSALRRRRPSTSQSINRVNSPPPQTQTPVSPSHAVDDKLSRASALLNSVVDSIKEGPPTPTASNVASALPEDQTITPNTRRNRDLAHVLFGTEDEAREEQQSEAVFQPITNPEPVFTRPLPLDIPSTDSSNVQTPPTAPTAPSVKAESISSPSFNNSPYLLLRNPSAPRIPPTPKEQAELAREVQEKTDAAMIALNKNPSRTNLGDTLSRITSVRRKVDPSQISSPTFVSTTTSVETIPLRSPSILSNNTGAGATKLGSRFRKLRGSLRAKNLASSGEETVTPESLKSPPASQTAFYDPAKLNPPGGPKLSSATDTRFKVPVPSPPASAGPGLKGFMARFRNKQRMAEIPHGNEHSLAHTASPLSPTSPLTPRQAEYTTPKLPSTPTERARQLTPRPAGQPRPMYSRFPPANAPVSSPPPTQDSQEPQTPQADVSQSAADLEQLFKAANNLGLDAKDINELLARSGSTSSRNLLSRNASVSKPKSIPPNTVQQVTYVGSTSSDQTATPTNYRDASFEQHQLNPGNVSDIRPVIPDDTVTRKSSTRRPDQLRRPKDGHSENAGNQILRRTVVLPADLSPEDFAALTQRKNSARKKRASMGSVSSRSVHDRAPTPPPPKSGMKRFSADGMPPMPQMPNLLGQADKMLNAPSTSTTGPIEKSNSTHESLYDMYSGDSRAASALAMDPNVIDPQTLKGESVTVSEGPAIEIIQLANGETIWNIVEGLRAADDMSIYSGRTSFASEYSTREPGNDGLQSFTKEHARSGSKGSLSSFVSKKKSQQQGKIRPDTNYFLSSSAHIGRLIESLAGKADAGSFNIHPNRNQGHSASSSLSTNDMNWTVEERLEHMLGSMNRS